GVEPSASAPFSPAKGVSRPVHFWGGRRQPCFQLRQHTLGATDQRAQVISGHYCLQVNSSAVKTSIIANLPALLRLRSRGRALRLTYNLGLDRPDHVLQPITVRIAL